METRHLFFQIVAAGGSDAVRLAAVFDFEAANPAKFFKTGDGAVESSWAEADAGEKLDVLSHGVAVFFAVGEAGEDEESGIGQLITPCVVSYNVVGRRVKGVFSEERAVQRGEAEEDLDAEVPENRGVTSYSWSELWRKLRRRWSRCFTGLRMSVRL